MDFQLNQTKEKVRSLAQPLVVASENLAMDNVCEIEWFL